MRKADNLPPSSAVVMKSGNLKFLEHSGPFQTCNGTAFFLNFLQCPTNVQLFHKLSHSYMFRHYYVILRQPVINTLPSYTGISNAAVGNTIVFQGYTIVLPTAAFEILV